MSSQRSNVDPRVGPLAPGDRLEQYEILRLLAAGRRSFVYEAKQEPSARRVALKVIADPSGDWQRARAEARFLTKLNHPKLVRVLDAGVGQSPRRGAAANTTAGPDLVYLVMELLDGRSLREAYLEHGKLTPAEMLAVGVQIAHGIEAAHAEKIIHRALEPSKVFLQEGNQVKVLDFGLAKFLEQLGADTKSGVLHESLLYRAPEQLRALGVTPRSDIFALGTILYEGLAGKPPALISAARRGIETPSLVELCELSIAEPPPDLEELVPGLPRHVAGVVHKMIARQPEDRQGSMREVAEALAHGSRRLLEGSGGRSDLRPLWGAAKLGLPPSPGDPFDPTPPPAAATGRFQAHPSRPRFMTLGIVVAVLAGVAMAIAISRARREPEALVPLPSAPAVAGAAPAAPSKEPVSAAASVSGAASGSAPPPPPAPASASAPRRPALLESARPQPATPPSAPVGEDRRRPWLE